MRGSHVEGMPVRRWAGPVFRRRSHLALGGNPIELGQRSVREHHGVLLRVEVEDADVYLGPLKRKRASQSGGTSASRWCGGTWQEASGGRPGDDQQLPVGEGARTRRFRPKRSGQVEQALDVQRHPAPPRGEIEGLDRRARLQWQQVQEGGSGGVAIACLRGEALDRHGICDVDADGVVFRTTAVGLPR